MRVKLTRFASAVRGYGNAKRVEARLARLKELGYVDTIPTRIQRIVGAVDMMRFFIVPCAGDYYRSKDISFQFHLLLRFLDDPASVIDPTGFNSTRDAIIGHVMQVVHANPHYDFQLLETFEDGLDEMEGQVIAILEGTHPRAASILAIVEDPDYHRRLLEHIQAYRRDPTVTPLLRENIAANSAFRRAERIFGTVPSAMRYFSLLPKTVRGGVRHLLRVRELPAPLAQRVEERCRPPAMPGR
jgi:hypothetical protein